MRAERHAVAGDFPQIAEAEHLKSAAVRQDCAIPRHEFMQAAELPDQVVAGAQIQMIGVAQNDLGVHVGQHLRQHSFDRALRPDRHEDRRRHVAVRGRERPQAGAGMGVCGVYLKIHVILSAKRR